MHTDVAVYRLDHRHVLRLLGLRMVVAAVLVAVAGVLLGSGNDVVRATAYVLGAAAFVLVVLVVVPLIRPPAVVRLDEHGYRVRRVRDCGMRSAPWLAVSRVDDAAGALGQTLVLELEGGRTTRIPLVLVAGQARRLQHDVRERLDRAHGYRRLPTPGSPEGTD